MIIIGIDPGLKGGIALIGSCVSPSPWVIPMPTKEVIVNKKRKQEIDGEELSDILWAVAFASKPVIYIEQVSARPDQGVTSMFSFGNGYGLIRGIAIGYDLPIKFVTPTRWKNEVLGKAYPHDKAGAIAYCKEHHPEVNLVPPGHRVPSDGCADALCIAEYGMRKEG